MNYLACPTCATAFNNGTAPLWIDPDAVATYKESAALIESIDTSETVKHRGFFGCWACGQACMSDAYRVTLRTF